MALLSRTDYLRYRDGPLPRAHPPLNLRHVAAGGAAYMRRPHYSKTGDFVVYVQSSLDNRHYRWVMPGEIMLGAFRGLGNQRCYAWLLDVRDVAGIRVLSWPRHRDLLESIFALRCLG